VSDNWGAAGERATPPQWEQTAARDHATQRAHLVLVEHQRNAAGNCRCGWGISAADLGKSFAHHVIDQLGRAGVTLELAEVTR
jgi:hypothetical protein